MLLINDKREATLTQEEKLASGSLGRLGRIMVENRKHLTVFHLRHHNLLRRSFRHAKGQHCGVIPE